MIVVDANIVISLVCNVPLCELARRVYGRDPEWRVPSLWEAEVLNGLLVMSRGGACRVDAAILAWENALRLLAGREQRCHGPAVLRTAAGSGLSAYDAHYVMLARSLGVKLVTEDGKIVRTCPDVAVSMKAFLGLEKPPAVVRETRAAYRTRRKK